MAEGVGSLQYRVYGHRAPLLLEHIVGRRRQCRGAVTGGLEDAAMSSAEELYVWRMQLGARGALLCGRHGD